MSDYQRLIQLAAKAAGIEGKWVEYHQAYGDEWVCGVETHTQLWNPIDNDSDALRLMVKMRFLMSVKDDNVILIYGQDGSLKAEVGILNKDIYQAVRTAITTAAAGETNNGQG